MIVVGRDVCACLGGGQDAMETWGGVGRQRVSLFFIVFTLSGESLLLGLRCHSIYNVIEYFG